jgi:phage shock protein PspC (stress-responsive transcriptional regulator)
MKEITRIHLAKTPYSIELDAKIKLEKYLKDIERRMESDADVMREIEARMVELLADRGVASEGVINGEDVAALQEQMGEPKEFSEDDETGEVADAETSFDSDTSTKRLMRDTDRAVFGGVCAGIAAYFNINPLWIRLLAIISPFMSFGSSVLVYIVLWLAMPPARTAAEKLQMRGQPVTLEALKQVSESEPFTAQTEHVVLKVVRVLASVGFVAVAFSALIGLLAGGIAGVGIIASLDGLSAQPWAWGLWVSLAIGGAAGVSLAILLAYSLFVRKLKKGVVIVSITAFVMVALSLSSAAIFGVQTAGYMEMDRERLTKVVPLNLPENIEGVTQVEGSGDIGVSIDSRGDAIRAELRYFSPRDSQPPKVEVIRDGDKLTVFSNYDDSESCSRGIMAGLHHCSFRTAEVKFYGPVKYYLPQSSHEVEDGDDSGYER